jgi:hypothetical protein
LVESVPRFSFGKRTKEKVIEASPGPCYNPKAGQVGLNQKPKFSIKSKYKVKMESTPGPADYYYNAVNSTPALSGLLRKKIQRPSTVNEQLPGPSDYSAQISATKQQGPSFSLRKRLDSNKGIN